MTELQTKIEHLPGVGIKTAAKFAKIGVTTFEDLLYYFPRAYRDFSVSTPIANISSELADSGGVDNNFTISGSILGITSKKTRRRGFTVTEAVVSDETGTIKVVWFNQPYLEKMLRTGSELILNGLVDYDHFAGGYVMESPIRADRATLMAVYRETGRLSSFYIQKIVAALLKQQIEIEEWMPEKIMDGLFSIQKAIEKIHTPADQEELTKAKRRLAFNELFLISLRGQLAKRKRSQESGVSIQVESEKLDLFIKALPFELTVDQQKAIDEIKNDLAKTVPMNRLLNGDVGSGKTVVAAVAAKLTVQAGYKTLFMVPTEILAFQHYESFKKLFNDSLVGIVTASQKVNIEAPILIGTHALLYMKTPIENVGLVIADEQHRFGVAQRAALNELNVGNSKPHFLSMTATPIPRTMHLAVFGELDVSVIRTKPIGRKEIKTRFVEPENRQKAYDFIGKQIEAGRQAFVICPLIEEKTVDPTTPRLRGAGSEHETVGLFEEERKTVKTEYEKLQLIYPEYEIGILHGKMKAKEKEEVMSKFASNEINLLVATSVVEVGVDIPNASVMMIEDAERFGLAQIHQFRGRVGRAEHQSFCFLFSSTRGEKSLARMHQLENVSDGFELAQIDLETRGPGAIFGIEQSGISNLKMASMGDIETMDLAVQAAKTITPEIDKYPKLIEKMKNFESALHME
ncbi:MAG: ATP-dependent DNA helicase RecG [Candidatus Berkelbacteria bacterium]